MTSVAYHTTICKNCRRPVMELDEGRLVHVDANIDQPLNPGFCIPELFVEPAVHWGFQRPEKR